MQTVSSFLDLRNVQGTRVYGIRDTDYTLVKRNDQTGDFEPVDKIDHDISSTELDAKYGVWVDAEKTHGWWHKKVDRPKDGKVQADEVVDFGTFRQQQQSVEGHWLYGTSVLYTCEAAGIRQQDVGNGEKSLVLDTQWNSRHIEAQFTSVSRLSPPYVAGWRDGMVGD